MENKKLIPLLVIVAIIVIVLGGWWYIAKHHSANTMGSMNNGTTSNSGSATPVATNQVTIQNFAFSPSEITVKSGTTVTWTNKDSVAHTVTENDGQTGPASSDIQPGATFSFTFNTPGTYHYHCSIHSEMLGIVSVTQ